jgi:hypothetical protein
MHIHFGSNGNLLMTLNNEVCKSIIQDSPSLLAGRYYTETPHPGRKPDLAFLLHLGNLRRHGEVCEPSTLPLGPGADRRLPCPLVPAATPESDCCRWRRWTHWRWLCQTGSRTADGTLPAAGMNGAATPVVRLDPERKIGSKSWATKAEKLGLGCEIRPVFF